VRSATTSIVGPQRSKADRLRSGANSPVARDPKLAAAIEKVREQYEKRHRR
jgi:hypothetical protein